MYWHQPCHFCLSFNRIEPFFLFRRGVAKDLEVPFWARDASETGVDRSMDLPCYGAKLKGDYNPPFTCGSDTRRSIIKYFVRDEINRDSAGNSVTESLIRKRIQMLKEVWKDTRNFPCKCPSEGEKRSYGAYSLACCKVYGETFSADSEPCTCLDGESVSVACCANGNNFMPDTIGGVLFDEVPADDVVAAIIEKIEPYIAGILTDKEKHKAFKRYNNKDKVAKWDWSSTGMGESATKASGLYSTQDPIMFYNASEAGYPFRGDSTMWEMCSGLVGQVNAASLLSFALEEAAFHAGPVYTI